MSAIEKFDSWQWRQYKPLIGQPLASVETIDEGEAVRFSLLDGRTLTYDAYGDCCSHSWVEYLTAPDILGVAITDVSEPELPHYPASPVLHDTDDYETIKVYHTAFHTERGLILVEYRNSSNGYYGGSLEGPREGNA